MVFLFAVTAISVKGRDYMMNIDYIRTALTCKERECSVCPCHDTTLCHDIYDNCHVTAPEDILEVLDLLGIDYKEVYPYEDSID